MFFLVPKVQLLIMPTHMRLGNKWNSSAKNMREQIFRKAKRKMKWQIWQPIRQTRYFADVRVVTCNGAADRSPLVNTINFVHASISCGSTAPALSTIFSAASLMSSSAPSVPKESDDLLRNLLSAGRPADGLADARPPPAKVPPVVLGGRL